MHAEQKITVNRDVMDKAMSSLNIGSLGQLAEKLRPVLFRVSESSIHRWNASGWPEHKFKGLCLVLGVPDESLRQ